MRGWSDPSECVTFSRALGQRSGVAGANFAKYQRWVGPTPLPPVQCSPLGRRPRGEHANLAALQKTPELAVRRFQEGNRFVGSAHGPRRGSCPLLIIYYLNGDPEQQGGPPGVNRVIDVSLESAEKMIVEVDNPEGVNF